MEFSKEQIELYKKDIIDTLHSFDVFCKAHNLTYFAAYGTVLGAVRHKGFIPWDDDVDVFMPRADYVRLLKLKHEIEKGFTLYSIEETPNYSASFYKYSHEKYTIWEKSQYDFIMGAYIDIFPLDTTAPDHSTICKMKEKYRLLAKKLLLSRQKPSIHLIWEQIKKRKLQGALWQISVLYRHAFCQSKALKDYEAYTQKMVEQGDPNGGYLVSYLGPYGAKDIYNQKWFSDFIEVPFETTTIRIPKEYDAYLRHVYGDYMKLPPVERRVTHHYRYFYDFSRFISIDEAKKAVKSISRKDLKIKKLDNAFSYPQN